MKPLLAYLRQSRGKEATISFEDQLGYIETWAKAHDDVPIAEPPYLDRGKSGGRDWRKRELGEIVARIKSGEAQGIIVAFQDRLQRPTWLQEAELSEELAAADARLVCAAEGTDFKPGDVNGMDARMLWRLKAAIARQKLERAIIDGAAARRDAIERGAHVGPRPLGYNKNRQVLPSGKPGLAMPLTVNSEEAEVVRAAFAARKDGASWKDVAAVLSQGTGRRWSLKATSKLLANRAYLGEIRSGEFVNRMAHEPIIDVVTFNRVQESRKRKTRHTRRPPGLLSGLIFCAECGHRLSQDRNARTTFYRCGNAGGCTSRVSVTHRQAEPWVIEHALFFWLGCLEKPSTPDDLTSDLDAAVQRAQEALSAVEALRGKIHHTSYGQAHSDALMDLEEAEKARADYVPAGKAPSREVLKRLEETLERGDEASVRDELRALIERAVEKIVVHRGREQKLTIHFKDGEVVRRDAPKVETLLQEMELPVQERAETLHLLQRRRGRRARRAGDGGDVRVK
jgi:hypothetical protein